ncbi:MAG: fluoride efflux transporter CrcB [Gammaproteobacteria bacterium]|nr:fluoride efflux transporter CrcB [Gammaproteobacteria bacterium]
MKQLIAIALGGAAGAVLRYEASTTVYRVLGQAFPYGTLTVNTVGSLCMGFLYVLFLDRFPASPELRALLLVGLLGAFTTFSTFSLETLNLLEQGESIKALLNVLLSVVLCIGSAWVGLILGRQI